MAARKHPHDLARKNLREFGLGLPGAHTKSPWPGHLDLAVKDKTFAYINLDGEPLRISCKLPHSNAAALLLPFVTPAAYGLGKSGWVAAEFVPEQSVPIEMLREWIVESYRAQAPKTLLKVFDGAADSSAKIEKKKASKKSSTGKKATRSPARGKRSA